MALCVVRFLWLFVVYIIGKLCVTGPKPHATSIWYNIMILDCENWHCTELDPETLRNRHWIARMLSAHDVYRYLDEWAIMQTWYRNLCLVYFSLCTEFYGLNCKSDAKLVTGNITCLQLQRRVWLYEWWNCRFNFFVKTNNMLLYTEVLEFHFVFVYRIARSGRITWVLVRISTPKWALPNIVVTTPLCCVLMPGLF